MPEPPPASSASRRLTSYSSQLAGPRMFVREALSLMRAHGGDPSHRVATSIAELQEVERLVLEHAGLRLEGLEMLDLGAGQRLVQMTYFAARGNRVTGIDRDLVVRGFDPLGYLRMARSNGLWRVLKTLGRKALRVDARYAAELHRRLGAAPDTSSMHVFQMDATELEFPDESFDFGYSLTVLQYVDDPPRALSELARVVRPGGGVYVDLLPFTGVIGSFDIRALAGEGDTPRWAHLRPAVAPLVSDSAYLNRFGLGDWRRAFEAAMPGCVIIPMQPDRDELESIARQLHEQGELVDYDLDELLTSQLVVVWRKPAAR